MQRENEGGKVRIHGRIVKTKDLLKDHMEI